MTKIAIVGGSATGKSAVARALAAAKALALRNCGEEVKKVARLCGISVDNVSEVCHREIDAESQRFVMQSGPVLLEGRFLRYVLSAFPEALMVIELTANIEIRRDRWASRASRANRSVTLEEVLSSDGSDVEFTSRMYAGLDPLPSYTINTSKLTVKQVVSKILKLAP